MENVPKSGGSRYVEIADELCADVRAGKYAVARTFPSLTRIMRRFGVARATAAKCVDELKRRGVVFAMPRSRLVVRKSNRTIGLIVPGVAVTDFFKPVVSEINRLARDAGYELRFSEVWSEVRKERIAQVREFAAEFIRGNFAGVIYEPLAGPIGDEINPHIL